jgi:hypothetical protein
VRPAEIVSRALAAIPPIVEGESIRDYESRLEAWTVGRPRIEWAAAGLTFAAAQLSALDTVTKPSSVTGRPTIGDKAMSGAERLRRHRANPREAPQRSGAGKCAAGKPSP